MENFVMNNSATLSMDEQTLVSFINNVENIVVHGERFHADDVFCVALIKYLNPTNVIRDRTFETYPDNTLVADTGNEVSWNGDHQILVLDHHQRYGWCIRHDGNKHAACGLVWRAIRNNIFAKLNIVGNKNAIDIVNMRIADIIDKIEDGDNGVVTGEADATSLGVIISAFNSSDVSNKESQNKQFDIAVSMVSMILENLFSKAVESVLSYTECVTAIERESANSSNTIMLNSDEVQGWKLVLRLRPELFDHKNTVLFHAPDGTYRVQAIPSVWNQPFANKALAPTNIRGLRGSEMSKASGIDGCIFCHPSGFLCGAESLESAIQLAFRFEPIA